MYVMSRAVAALLVIAGASAAVFFTIPFGAAAAETSCKVSSAVAVQQTKDAQGNIVSTTKDLDVKATEDACDDGKIYTIEPIEQTTTCAYAYKITVTVNPVTTAGAPLPPGYYRYKKPEGTDYIAVPCVAGKAAIPTGAAGAAVRNGLGDKVASLAKAYAANDKNAINAATQSLATAGLNKNSAVLAAFGETSNQLTAENKEKLAGADQLATQLSLLEKTAAGETAGVQAALDSVKDQQSGLREVLQRKFAFDAVQMYEKPTVTSADPIVTGTFVNDERQWKESTGFNTPTESNKNAYQEAQAAYEKCAAGLWVPRVTCSAELAERDRAAERAGCTWGLKNTWSISGGWQCSETKTSTVPSPERKPPADVPDDPALAREKRALEAQIELCRQSGYGADPLTGKCTHVRVDSQEEANRWAAEEVRRSRDTHCAMLEAQCQNGNQLCLREYAGTCQGGNPYSGVGSGVGSGGGGGGLGGLGNLFGGQQNPGQGGLSPGEQRALERECFDYGNSTACKALQRNCQSSQQQGGSGIMQIIPMITSLIGGQSGGLGGLNKEQCASLDKSISNSMCRQYAGTQFQNGRCECPNDKEWSGTECRTKNTCAQYPGTELKNGRCECPADKQWDGARCVGSDGSTQNPNDNREPELACSPPIADIDETPIAISWQCFGADVSSGDGFNTDGKTSGSATTKLKSADLNADATNVDLTLTCSKGTTQKKALCPIEINRPLIVAVVNPSVVEKRGDTANIGWIVKGMKEGNEVCELTSNKHADFSKKGRNGVFATPPIEETTTFTIRCTTRAGATKKVDLEVRIK
ncbi:MAG: hypothetical protein HYT30_01170 [Parcubacteria group bacterium]|nr:hypothetical protein [Parcubacteria group bacterium]